METDSVDADTATPNQHLPDDVRERVESLDHDTCEAWGGDWRNGTAHVRDAIAPKYNTPTRVTDAESALDAFDKYDDWFEHVLHTHEPDHDACVLLPCGATKPIGASSIHQKKLDALDAAGYTEFADIVIISEPCTVVPHEKRLSMAPVNYDFPPEWTQQDIAPEVFHTFTGRLARFIDRMPYDTYYPYLVEGHQEKFDAARKKAIANPSVVEIPGASLGLESESYSGDLFKSLDDVTAKLEFVRALAHDDRDLVASYPESVREFYAERPEYGGEHV